MNHERLEREEVVRVAIALKRLEEFKDKDIHELVDTACDLLLFAEGRIPTVQKSYFERSHKFFSPDEAAQFITGIKTKSRARERFAEFKEFLSQPSNSVNEFERKSIHRTLELGSDSIYTEWFCRRLQVICSSWSPASKKD